MADNYAEIYRCSNGPLLAETSKALLNSIRSGKTQPFPPPIKSNDTSIYHFYSIAHLTNKLIQNGAPKETAFAVTGGFNLACEVVTKDARTIATKVITGKNKKSYFRKEAEKDIYIGFAGALFATHSSLLSQRIDQNEFHKSLRGIGVYPTLRKIIEVNKEQF